MEHGSPLLQSEDPGCCWEGSSPRKIRAAETTEAAWGSRQDDSALARLASHRWLLALQHAPRWSTHVCLIN